VYSPATLSSVAALTLLLSGADSVGFVEGLGVADADDLGVADADAVGDGDVDAVVVGLAVAAVSFSDGC
jgi:hypothetical protein